MAQDKSYLATVYGGGATPDAYTQALADHLVARYLPALPADAHLLDVGCGTGRQAVAFSRHLKVSCLDREDMCRDGFAALGLDIPFAACDLERQAYPFAGASFDVVFSKSVIEHLRDFPHYLAETRRLLKPGGTTVVMCPSWTTQWRCFYDDPTHVQPFTQRGLTRALEMAGFQGITVCEFYQFPAVWRLPALRWGCRLLASLPDGLKWKDADQRHHRKIIRFSKETMLLAVARNPDGSGRV